MLNKKIISTRLSGALSQCVIHSDRQADKKKFFQRVCLTTLSLFLSLTPHSLFLHLYSFKVSSPAHTDLANKYYNMYACTNAKRLLMGEKYNNNNTQLLSIYT